MNEKNKTKIIVAVIGLVGTIVGAIGGHVYAQNQQSQYIKSQLVNIEGNNNSVVINDVDDLVKEYNKVLGRNETLEEQNTSYFNDLAQTKDKLKFLEEQLGDIPQISYKSLDLVIDAQNIFINKTNSMVTIDGKDYFSREITENLLPDGKNLTIKDETIFVGTVVTDKANLTSKKIMSSSNCTVGESATDSYGNTYSNTLHFDYKGHIIYVLDGKYSLLKFVIAISEKANMGETGIITIKADENIIYTSPSLNKTTEAFVEINVPINNCKLLTIEYDTVSWNNHCIMSDIIVYNE